jgi:glycine cleavage system transcriptional repressor
MTQTNKDNYLVISALGEDHPGIVNRFTQAIHESGANIADSRMTTLGGEFAILLLVSAPWNAIAKLEDQLPGIGKSLELTVSSKRTSAQKEAPEQLPYHVEVVAIDTPGIVYRLSDFFSGQGCNIHDLQTNRYLAAHTGAPLFSLHMAINLPRDKSVSQIREQFFTLCDELNLDGIIEPIKL